MIQKHPYFFASLIGLLVLLNLFRWVPSWFGRGTHMEIAGGIEKLNLSFPDPVEEQAKNPTRDLFNLANSPPVHRMVKAVPHPARPLPTPTLSSPDGSVAEADGCRLMGIASRGSRSFALIGKGDQTFKVGPGDDIEGLYTVKSVSESEVYLTEKATGNTLKLHIWDAQGKTP